MLNTEQKDELLSLETQTPSLKIKYEQEIEKMTNNPLPKQKKIAFTISGIVCVLFTVFFITMFFIVPNELPLLARLSFLAGALASTSWAYIAFRIVKKGTMNLRTDGAALTGIMWVFIVMIMTVDLMIGMGMENAAQGARMILFGLVFLVMGVVFMLQHWIERTELNLQEQILRLELRIAEMNEDK